MVEKQITLPVTLHARPASALAKQVGGYQAKVEVGKGEKFVVAKSLIGIMSLGAKAGDSVTVRVDGPDEGATLEAVVTFLTNLSE
ncbi:MAG TPA: HPr family phosphocarrier protein [Symbiobacteriaceae bacterium]|nr:HPr family phosphocarrier protein [Symbiobacteriaceae bacterium]